MTLDRRQCLAGAVGASAGLLTACATMAAPPASPADLPDSLCYMPLNGEPRESIAAQFDDNDHRPKPVSEDVHWFARMVEDLFA